MQNIKRVKSRYTVVCRFADTRRECGRCAHHVLAGSDPQQPRRDEGDQLQEDERRVSLYTAVTLYS